MRGGIPSCCKQPSVDFRAGGAHRDTPLGLLGVHEFGKPLRRTAQRLAALGGEVESLYTEPYLIQ